MHVQLLAFHTLVIVACLFPPSPPEFLETMFARPVQLIPEAKRTTFVRELAKAALKKMKKNKDGTYTWVVRYVLVLARRPELL